MLMIAQHMQMHYAKLEYEAFRLEYEASLKSDAVPQPDIQLLCLAEQAPMHVS